MIAIILKIDLGSDSLEVKQPADFNFINLEVLSGLLLSPSVYSVCR